MDSTSRQATDDSESDSNCTTTQRTLQSQLLAKAKQLARGIKWSTVCSPREISQQLKQLDSTAGLLLGIVLAKVLFPALPLDPGDSTAEARAAASAQAIRRITKVYSSYEFNVPLEATSGPGHDSKKFLTFKLKNLLPSKRHITVSLDTARSITGKFTVVS